MLRQGRGGGAHPSSRSGPDRRAARSDEPSSRGEHTNRDLAAVADRQARDGRLSRDDRTTERSASSSLTPRAAAAAQSARPPDRRPHTTAPDPRRARRRARAAKAPARRRSARPGRASRWVESPAPTGRISWTSCKRAASTGSAGRWPDCRRTGAARHAWRLHRAQRQPHRVRQHRQRRQPVASGDHLGSVRGGHAHHVGAGEARPARAARIASASSSRPPAPSERLVVVIEVDDHAESAAELRGRAINPRGAR